MAVYAILTVVFYLLSNSYDFMESLVEFSRAHESWEMDEIFATALFLLLLSAVFSLRRWRESRSLAAELQVRNQELERSIAQVRQLSGLLNVCSSCRRIRDEGGRWLELETYVDSHSEASFSHGLCPDCARRLYPELDLSKHYPDQEG